MTDRTGPGNQGLSQELIAQWKAGYIADSQDLHLHTKSNVAGVIHFWGKDPLVADAFSRWAPRENLRWKKICAEVDLACLKASSRQQAG